MGNMVFPVRELLRLAPEEIFNTYPGKFDIVMEDGKTISTTKNRTYVTSFCWEILRRYPDTPIISKYHLEAVMKGKPYNASSHTDLLENITKGVVKQYNLIRPEQKEPVLDMIYDCVNAINNIVAPKAAAHVTTLNMRDFARLERHPPIVALRDKIPKDVHSKNTIIQDTYKEILRIIHEDPALDNNNLVRMCRAKIVNDNQILQCVGFLGFRTEVDGQIINHFNESNFVSGMNTIFDYASESRSAAKALYFSEAPLEDSEFFSRRLQLLTTVITKISYQDCGTNKYANWVVRPPTFNEEGKMVYPGDLKYLVGKYYLAEDGKTLLEIDGSEKHLENKMIRFRSSIFCKTPNKHHICYMCFGGLHHNVSQHANLGHLCAATMTQQTTQSVLSTKHLDASSRSVDIVLSEMLRRYFLLTTTKNGLILHKHMKDKKVKMEFRRDECAGLMDAISFPHFDQISPDRIASITGIDIHYTDSVGEVVDPVHITNDKRRPSFSIEFLQHLKKKGWETKDNGNFLMDFEGWNFNLPVLMYPEVEYSYADHSDQIAKLIESSVEKMVDRLKPNSPLVTLQELFNKVNDKLNMNIAPLEVIIASLMISEPDTYDLGRGDDNALLGVADRLIKNRSPSNAYGYKDQVGTIMSPDTFRPGNRPDSIFDVIFTPKEVIEHHDKMQQQQ